MVLQVAEELAVLAQPLLEPGALFGVEGDALLRKRPFGLAHASMVPAPPNERSPPWAGG